MKTKLFLLFALLYVTHVGYAMKNYVDINFNIVNPDSKGQAPPRSPVKTPDAYLDDHILYIYACEGCILQLEQNDEVVYSTTITSDIVELPESLSGIYQLQIIRGNYCFLAEIEL